MTSADKKDLLARSVPLATIAEGRRVRLVTIEGGYGFVARLRAMGLIPGARVLVIKNSGKGPFLLGVQNARIAIGRGMAYRIRVV